MTAFAVHVTPTGSSISSTCHHGFGGWWCGACGLGVIRERVGATCPRCHAEVVRVVRQGELF